MNLLQEYEELFIQLSLVSIFQTNFKCLYFKQFSLVINKIDYNIYIYIRNQFHGNTE